MSDEIERLYDAECAFVGRVKRGDKETIDSTSLIEHLRAENERLAAKNKEWRERDDAIRAEFGGKRDGRATIECLREAFAAPWSEEDALFQATLDMKTKELRAENERLRAALVAFADHFGPPEDNHMLHKEARRCFALARAALEGKP